MNPHHLLPSGYTLLSKQKAIWEQVNPALVPIYYISILTALWGVLYSMPGIYGRLSHEFLGVVSRRMAAMPYQRYSLYVGAFVIAAASFLLLSGIKPIRLMDVAAMLSTNVGIALLAILAFWANLMLPKAYRPHPVTCVFAVLAILILCGSAYLSITNF
jgi:hypothetical protein